MKIYIPILTNNSDTICSTVYRYVVKNEIEFKNVVNIIKNLKINNNDKSFIEFNSYQHIHMFTDTIPEFESFKELKQYIKCKITRGNYPE